MSTDVTNETGPGLATALIPASISDKKRHKRCAQLNSYVNQTLKGHYPNFLNLTRNREKFWL